MSSLPMEHCCDIAVVGASLAGASLAWQMGRAGYRTALIDKQIFPRSKSCGEGLSWQGVEALRRMDLFSALMESKPSFLSGYQLWWNNRTPVSIPYKNSLLGVQRRTLDAELLGKARSLSSVACFFGEKIRAADISQGKIQLETHTVSARFIVDASGGGFRETRRDGKKDAKQYGITHHIFARQSVPQDKVNIFILPEGELFCTPLGPSHMNVSVIGDASHSREKIRGERARHEIERALQNLGWTDLEFLSVCSASIPRIRRAACFPPRVLRIGDACEQFDPIGGMGMTHALLSSEEAARALQAILSGRMKAKEGFISYSKRRGSMASALRAFTLLSASAIRSWGRVPVVGEFLTVHCGGRLSKIVHHPGESTTFERGLLSIIGAAL